MICNRSYKICNRRFFIFSQKKKKNSLLLVKERNKNKKPFIDFYYKTLPTITSCSCLLPLRPKWKTSDPDRTVKEEHQTEVRTVQVHSVLTVVIVVCKISGLTALPTPITRPGYPKITRTGRKKDLRLRGDLWIQIYRGRRGLWVTEFILLKVSLKALWGKASSGLKINATKYSIKYNVLTILLSLFYMCVCWNLRVCDGTTRK